MQFFCCHRSCCDSDHLNFPSWYTFFSSSFYQFDILQTKAWCFFNFLHGGMIGSIWKKLKTAKLAPEPWKYCILEYFLMQAYQNPSLIHPALRHNEGNLSKLENFSVYVWRNCCLSKWTIETALCPAENWKNNNWHYSYYLPGILPVRKSWIVFFIFFLCLINCICIVLTCIGPNLKFKLQND